MLIVGLTGGISTGKSTASKYIKNTFGFPIIDTDEIAREIVKPGTAGHREIVACFGTGVLETPTETSELDRAALGRIIFADPRQRKKLNDITHPKIAWIVFKKVCWAYLTLERVVILDVPLLFEAGWNKFLDTTILVTCDLETQVKRLMNRDNLSDKSEAMTKINAQWSMEKKKSMSRFIVHNDRDIPYLTAQLDRIFHSITPSKASTLAWLILPWLFAPVSMMGAIFWFGRRGKSTVQKQKQESPREQGQNSPSKASSIRESAKVG